MKTPGKKSLAAVLSAVLIVLAPILEPARAFAQMNASGRLAPVGVIASAPAAIPALAISPLGSTPVSALPSAMPAALSAAVPAAMTAPAAPVAAATPAAAAPISAAPIIAAAGTHLSASSRRAVAQTVEGVFSEFRQKSVEDAVSSEGAADLGGGIRLGKASSFLSDETKPSSVPPAIRGSSERKGLNPAARVRQTLLRPMRTAVAALALTLAMVSPGLAGTANLAWDLVTNAPVARYEIWYGEQARTEQMYPNKLAEVDNATSSYTATLPDGKTYFFAVRGALTDGRFTGFSAEVAKAFPLSGVPLLVNTASRPTRMAAPASVTNVTTSGGGGRVALAWTPSADTAGVMIVKTTAGFAPDGPFDSYATNAGNILNASGQAGTFEDTQVAAGVDTVYHLYPYNADSPPTFGAPVQVTATAGQTPTVTEVTVGKGGCSVVPGQRTGGAFDVLYGILLLMPWMARRLLKGTKAA